jgi:molybdate/tungstate transport system permease protein
VKKYLPAAGVVLALAACHVGLALVPEPPFTLEMNFVLFGTNLYVLHSAAAVLKNRSGRSLGLFLAGYLVLVVLALVILDRKSLFVLLAVLYASVFGSPFLLGLFGLFVLSFVVFQPYAFETFVPLVLIFAVIWRLRRSASPFLLACLGGGLLAFTLVLFPLLHLVIQDSAQTLGRTLLRDDVQRALLTSIGTSTLATLIVAIWGIPLAYALARLDFPGKGFVESAIDVPILVPQPVVGIALVVLLGPGSPLGQWLEGATGLRFSGTFIGIVTAQVFVCAPFLVKTAMTAFEGVPRHLEAVSRTLGVTPAKTFARIALPLASQGLITGLVLAWARAISEFGSILLFASSPLTAPVLVHNEFLRAGVSESRSIAVLLLLICLWIFIGLQFGRTLLPFAWRHTEKRA